MSIAGATTNLLLVDDDPIAAAVTERAVDSAPATVELRIAGDGFEAYRYISGAGLYADRAAYPLPDVILLDIHTPRFSGLEFLRWLRRQAPETARSIAVIIVSGSCNPEELEQARTLGARMLVPKPVNWPELWHELLAAGLLKTEHTDCH